MCLILEPVIANGDLFYELSDDPAESNITDLSPWFCSSYNQLSFFLMGSKKICSIILDASKMDGAFMI